MITSNLIKLARKLIVLIVLVGGLVFILNNPPDAQAACSISNDCYNYCRSSDVYCRANPESEANECIEWRFITGRNGNWFQGCLSECPVVCPPEPDYFGPTNLETQHCVDSQAYQCGQLCNALVGVCPNGGHCSTYSVAPNGAQCTCSATAYCNRVR